MPQDDDKPKAKSGVGAVRIRDWIYFTNFALLSSKPETLNVRDHLFPYEGAKSSPGLLWGVYGLASTNAALFLAEDYARKQGKLVMSINMWFHVPNLDDGRKHITEEVANHTGFLQTQRLTQEFRQSLLEQAQAWARKNVDAAVRAHSVNLNLEDFMMRHPAFVRSLFDVNPKLNLITHPVRQIYNPDDKRKFWVATCRADPAHIKKAEVRFMPEIEITY